MEKYTFLNEYWKILGKNCDVSKVRSNKHFNLLNDYLLSNVKYKGIPEDSIECYFTNRKKWDIHFNDLKLAVEYKTITSPRNMHNRIEEAIGSAINLKKFNPEYKTGYLLIFAYTHRTPSLINMRDRFISTFDKLIETKIYDYMCAIETLGIDNHHEITKKYTFDNFVSCINNNIASYEIEEKQTILRFIK